MAGVTFTDEQVAYLLVALGRQRLDLEMHVPGCDCCGPELEAVSDKYGEYVKWYELASTIKGLPRISEES